MCHFFLPLTKEKSYSLALQSGFYQNSFNDLIVFSCGLLAPKLILRQAQDKVWEPGDRKRRMFVLTVTKDDFTTKPPI
jgi:hypothetical protein